MRRKDGERGLHITCKIGRRCANFNNSIRFGPKNC
jgi:hypothetical protein